MSQKELLYVEDGINHERMVISYLNDSIEKIEDKNLKNFLLKELKNHEKLEKNLLKVLEVSANEW